jgi:hypothetical protein
MGVDFLRKTAPNFQRSIDRQRVALRTPKLFARDIPLMARTARANICHSAAMAAGEKVLLRVQGEKLVAQRENLIIAEFPSPPAEFVNQLQCGAGVAEGEVKSVSPLSETVEIGICD